MACASPTRSCGRRCCTGLARARAPCTPGRRAAEARRAPEELATHLLHVEPAGTSRPSRPCVRPRRAQARWARRPPRPPTSSGRSPSRPAPSSLRGADRARAGRGPRRPRRGDRHLRRPSRARRPGRARHAALELARALKFGGDAVQAVDVLEALEPDLDALDPELRELVELEHIGLAYISQGARERLAARIAALRDPGASRAPGWRLRPRRARVRRRRRRPRPAAEAAGRGARGRRRPDPDRPDQGGYGMLIAGVATMWADRSTTRAGSTPACWPRAAGADRSSCARPPPRCSRSSTGAAAGSPTPRPTARWRSISQNAEGTDALVNAARAVKALVALARGADEEELARIEADVLRGSDPDALPYHLVLHARGLVRVARGDLERGMDDLSECGRVSVAGARATRPRCRGAPTPRWRSRGPVGAREPCTRRRGARARRGFRRQARDRHRPARGRAGRRRRDHDAGAGARGRDARGLARRARPRDRDDRPRRRPAPRGTTLRGARERHPRAGAGDELRRDRARAPGPGGGARRGRPARRVALRGVDSLTPASCASPSGRPRGTPTARSPRTCS